MERTGYLDKELLDGFDSEERAKNIFDTKASAIAAISLFPIFYILDLVIYPELSWSFLTIRLMVVAVSLAIFGLMYTDFGRRQARLFGTAQYIQCCYAILFMIYQTGSMDSPYYAGINLVLLAFLVILPFDIKRTIFICAAVYAGFILPAFIPGMVLDAPAFINNNFFLLSTMLLGIASAHLAYRFRLHEFTSRFKLAKANAELTKLDTLKSQFFANVSHEVRTPLTSIISPVQSLYHGDVGRLGPDQQRLIGQVFRNSLKLLDMINQMLDFSKYEAGKMQLRLALVDIEELIQDLVSLFEEITERKGLKLRYIREGDLPSLYLDRNKIERVISNLIRNSIKFTETGSIIIRARLEHEQLVIEVEDTGIGIPAEHLPHLFERFRQVDGSTTRRYDGTGIGLTIVKEAVDLHRGTIGVSSELGKGTRFKVNLPIDLDVTVKDAFIERRGEDRRKEKQPMDGPERRQKYRRLKDFTGITADDLVFMEEPAFDEERAAQNDENREAGEETSGYRVLYVEDNSDLRSYIGKMLERFGHRVSLAVDGVEGWEAAQKDLPDAVVSDLMMPRMDGYELVRALKGSPRTRHIPVILITAKPGSGAKMKGLETGADDYLPKPVNIRELDARIRNHVTTRRFQQALTKTEELEVRMEQLSMSFAQSLELRDRATAGHSRDVLELGTLIAEELSIPADRRLKDSLLLHDIGKLGIPDNVLLKDAPLSNEEWLVMKTHAEMGADLLKNFDLFSDISKNILAHQEHIDGSGYPQGLKNSEIPLIARIIAVADAFHAMTHDRPYRRALSTSAAVAELLIHKGRQFDTAAVDALIRGLSRKGILKPAGSAAT